MNTTLTNKTQTGYACPVAGKIQQYGFCSSLKRWTMTTTVFALVVFLSVYFAPVGRDSQEASGLAVSFSRSANLIVSPSLRFAAQRGFTPTKRSTAMNTPATAAPSADQPATSSHPAIDLECTLHDHRAKLTFLSEMFSLPLAYGLDQDLSKFAIDGLSCMLFELRDEANDIHWLNLQLAQEAANA